MQYKYINRNVEVWELCKQIQCLVLVLIEGRKVLWKEAPSHFAFSEQHLWRVHFTLSWFLPLECGQNPLTTERVWLNLLLFQVIATFLDLFLSEWVRRVKCVVFIASQFFPNKRNNVCVYCLITIKFCMWPMFHVSLRRFIMSYLRLCKTVYQTILVAVKCNMW